MINQISKFSHKLSQISQLLRELLSPKVSGSGNMVNKKLLKSLRLRLLHHESYLTTCSVDTDTKSVLMLLHMDLGQYYYSFTMENGSQ